MENILCIQSQPNVTTANRFYKSWLFAIADLFNLLVSCSIFFFFIFSNFNFFLFTFAMQCFHSFRNFVLLLRELIYSCAACICCYRHQLHFTDGIKWKKQKKKTKNENNVWMKRRIKVNERWRYTNERKKRDELRRRRTKRSTSVYSPKT